STESIARIWLLAYTPVSVPVFGWQKSHVVDPCRVDVSRHLGHCLCRPGRVRSWAASAQAWRGRIALAIRREIAATASPDPWNAAPWCHDLPCPSQSDARSRSRGTLGFDTARDRRPMLRRGEPSP